MLIPANATVTDATVDISGLPYGSGELDDFRLSSIDTNGGSVSYAPEVVNNGDDLFVIWHDYGDLSDVNYENILFRSYTSSNWNDAVVLASSGTSSLPLLEYQTLARDGSTLYAAWESYGLLNTDGIHLRVSINSGNSWSDTKEVDIDENGYLYGLAMAATDGYVYVVYSDDKNTSGSDPDIYLVSSNDGGDSWSTPTLVSSTSDQSSLYPAVAVSEIGRASCRERV
mgnify:FL=1